MATMLLRIDGAMRVVVVTMEAGAVVTAECPDMSAGWNGNHAMQMVAAATEQMAQQEQRTEEARQIAKDRYTVVTGLWIEPAAKVQTTSDGRRHVMAWIMVDGEEP